MDTRNPDARKRWSGHIALVLALAALALSLPQYVLRDRVEYPSISFIRFRDRGTDESIGFMKAEYGELTIARFAKNAENRVELKLCADDSVTIDLNTGAHTAARWSLSEDGEKFEKLSGELNP